MKTMRNCPILCTRPRCTVPQHTTTLHCQMHFPSWEKIDMGWCWKWGNRWSLFPSVVFVELTVINWSHFKNDLISILDTILASSLWITFRGFPFVRHFFLFSPWTCTNSYWTVWRYFLFCLQWGKWSKIWPGSGLPTVKSGGFYSVLFIHLFSFDSLNDL